MDIPNNYENNNFFEYSLIYALKNSSKTFSENVIL